MYEVYSETHSQEAEADLATASTELWSEVSKAGRFSLKSTLSANELRQVIGLYESQNEVSIMQHPEWDSIVAINGEVRYFTFHKDNKLLAYAIMRFPNARKARVEFGPVAVSQEAAHEALRSIIRCVQEVSKVWSLRLQLPWQTGKKTAYVKAKLNNEFDIVTFHDKRNWNTSVIDTSLSDEELYKGFSKNHRRSIKKAQKLGLNARVCDTESDIRAFNSIYVRMYEARGRNIDENTNLEEYLRYLEFFQKTGNGFFYGVFEEDTMIGGMIMIKQGESGFYHHSASDPDHRKIPVQHIGVVSVLDELRERGIRYFDFGGYNHMVDESDQVYNINRFKDGFTKEYVYYPKLMYFEFVSNAINWLGRYQRFKNVIKKLIGR